MTLNEWIIKADQSKLEFIKKYDTGIEIIPDITSVAFIDIKRTIPDLISEGKFEQAIALIKNTKTSKILNVPELERFRMLVWIEKQYDKLNKIEKRYLERPPDFKMVAAGIKNLDVLGINNTIKNICKEYPAYKREEIRQMAYSECFEIQLEMVLWNDVNKKLVEQNKNERQSNRKK